MIAFGSPSQRTAILHNIDPMGLDEDPWGGTQHAIIRVGRYKLLLGNPGQNLEQVSERSGDDGCWW